MNYRYQVGLSLFLEAPSYVTRQADDQFYQALKEGRLCYVFNCRQMGKSSLRVQTMNRLLQEDFACVFLDMSRICSQDLTLESFYYTIAYSLADSLDISLNLSSWWQERANCSLQQRLSDFMQEILDNISKNIIIFIDEIDSILSLKFSTDDFFALIRSCYEQRVNNPTYQRLTFALLGVATPSRLIENKWRSPFNLGKFIELNGFTEEEALPLKEGLVGVAENPESVLKAILYWTGGQPFLTQKICQLVVDESNPIPEGKEATIIKDLVSRRVLTNWQSPATDNPQHLRTIEDRIILSEQSARLLGLYQHIVEQGAIESDDTPEQIELILTGLIINKEEKLRFCNPIYQQVFDKEWVLKELNKIRPYGETIRAWTTSGRDESWLLRGQALREALEWANDNNLNLIDRQYLEASRNLEIQQELERQELEYQQELELQRLERQQELERQELEYQQELELQRLERQQELERKELERQKLKFQIRITLIFSGLFTLVTLSFGLYYNYKYASCPIGERISGKCLRYIITSGDKPYLFIDNQNFHLEEGVKFFRQGKYQDALRLFKQAQDARPTDPVPHIYVNNTQARLKNNPLKLAVVVGIDLYKDVAQNILRGVADAQEEFNSNGGKNGRLLEIVIANDGNDPQLASKVATDLRQRPDILGIIGHHASESTQVAIPIYEQYRVPIVSPTSSSSQLKSEVFFRAVLPTTVSAEKYANYIKNTLGVDQLVIFSDPERLYSQSLLKDFQTAFTGRELGGEIIKKIDLNNDQLDIEEELTKIYKDNKTKAILVIPSVNNDSVTTAIAKVNSELASQFKREKLHLLTVMSLSEETTLKDGGDSLEEMNIMFPCLDQESKYSKEAKEKWHQKQIYWRTATGYDATQAFIEAIRLSKEPTREEILHNLQSLQLPKDKTSGSGLSWSRDEEGNVLGNANLGYCIYQIRNNRFEKIDPNEKIEK